MTPSNHFSFFIGKHGRNLAAVFKNLRNSGSDNFLEKEKL